jgi:hypothetical protein
MKFRNYCIVLMGMVDGSLLEIEKVSEGKIHTLNAKGVYIATFSSVLEPNEITEFFKSNKRNFLIFDLDVNNSGYNFIKDEIHNGLFGFLNSVNLEEKALDLLTSINECAEYKTEKEEINNQPLFSEEEINNMSLNQKKKLFDEILDKGVDNLSENDKKILPLLIK